MKKSSFLNVSAAEKAEMFLHLLKKLKMLNSLTQ